MKPIIKWAGGKGWMVKRLIECVPWGKWSGHYIEPFFGGGALFFGSRVGENRHCVLSDANVPRYR